MIEPIQPNGSRPPLFLIHGPYGVTGLGRALTDALPADQPLYFVHARGLDGSGEPCRTVKAMVGAYLPAIRKIWPSGPYLIGGIGQGSFAALEIVRELLLFNRRVGPVLMIDPGMAPHRTPTAIKALEPVLARPDVIRQLHDQAATTFLRYRDLERVLPFDPADEAQLLRAVDVGVATSLAFARHRVSPFYGTTELILTWNWARNFFMPQHEWQKVLPANRTFHVLQGTHQDLVDANQRQLAQMIAIYLESALDGELMAGEIATVPKEERFPSLLLDNE